MLFLALSNVPQRSGNLQSDAGDTRHRLGKVLSLIPEQAKLFLVLLIGTRKPFVQPSNQFRMTPFGFFPPPFRFFPPPFFLLRHRSKQFSVPFLRPPPLFFSLPVDLANFL